MLSWTFLETFVHRVQDIVDSDFDEPEEPDEDDDGGGGGDDHQKNGAGVNKERSSTATGSNVKRNKAGISVAEAEVRAEERRASRKDRPSKYVDPAMRRNKASVTQKKTSINNATSTSTPTPTSASASASVFGSVPGLQMRTSLRKSTKAASAKAAEERARRKVDEDERRKIKARRDAGRVPMKEKTQSERLNEAKVTEELNKQSLKELLKMEEDKKKVTASKKKQTAKRAVSVRSKNGVQTVSLTKDLDVIETLLPHHHYHLRQRQDKAKEKANENGDNSERDGMKEDVGDCDSGDGIGMDGDANNDRHQTDSMVEG